MGVSKTREHEDRPECTMIPISRTWRNDPPHFFETPIYGVAEAHGATRVHLIEGFCLVSGETFRFVGGGHAEEDGLRLYIYSDFEGKKCCSLLGWSAGHRSRRKP